MRRILRALIDFAAIYAVFMVVSSAHGIAWALVASGATAIYGVFCYVDGIFTGLPERATR